MRVVERCKTNMVELEGIWAKHGIAMCSMEFKQGNIKHTHTQKNARAKKHTTG